MGEGPEGIVHGFSLGLPLFSWSREAPGVLIGMENLGSLHLLPPESAMATGLLGEEVGGFLPLLCHSLARTLPSRPTPELNSKCLPCLCFRESCSVPSQDQVPWFQAPIASYMSVGHSPSACPMAALPLPHSGCRFSQGPAVSVLCT